MDKRNWGLDLLRALAILLVLLLHSAPFLQLPAEHPAFRFIYFGWSGVELFFVLSGYLVGLQALRLRDGNDTGSRFWLRRAFRTLPLYFVVLFTYVVIKPLAGFTFQEKVWPFFLFGQNYLAPRDFVQSWSLCIEEQFYLLLPLLVLAWPWKKIPAALWLLPVGVSFLFRYFILYEQEANLTLAEAAYRIQFPFHTHLDGLAAGLFLAATRERWMQWGRTTRFYAAVAGVALLAFTYAYASPTLEDRTALWAFTALSLGFSLLVPWAAALARPSGGQVVTWIALWSYGLYLWNNLAFRFWETQAIGEPAKMLGAWVGVFLLSAVTYHAVEKPGLWLRDFYLRKKRD